MSSLVSTQTRNTRNNRDKGKRTPKHIPTESDQRAADRAAKPPHETQADTALEWLRKNFASDPGRLKVCEEYIGIWRTSPITYRGKRKLTRLTQASKAMRGKYRGTAYAGLIEYIEQVVVDSA